jgi:mannose-6-phosphate isomerase-like protein (cupin superfamily)
MIIKHRPTLKHSLTSLFSISILSSLAAQSPLISKVYEWNNLPVKGKYGTQVRSIMKGETRSLEMFEIKAFTLIGGYSVKEYKISNGVDELLIVKEGMAVISINDRSERLGEGSIVVASQGDVVKVLNGAKNDLTFYSFKFRPHKSEDYATAGKSEPFIKEWNDIEFKENANGGRRDIMRQPVFALKELEMHTTLLKEGLPSHSSHTHADEEIILVRFGRVEESINGKTFQCGPGSVIFLTNDDDHGIRNVGEGPCEYYAIRWLTY